MGREDARQDQAAVVKVGGDGRTRQGGEGQGTFPTGHQSGAAAIPHIDIVGHARCQPRQYRGRGRVGVGHGRKARGKSGGTDRQLRVATQGRKAHGCAGWCYAGHAQGGWRYTGGRWCRIHRNVVQAHHGPPATGTCGRKAEANGIVSVGIQVDDVLRPGRRFSRLIAWIDRRNVDPSTAVVDFHGHAADVGTVQVGPEVDGGRVDSRQVHPRGGYTRDQRRERVDVCVEVLATAARTAVGAGVGPRSRTRTWREVVAGGVRTVPAQANVAWIVPNAGTLHPIRAAKVLRPWGGNLSTQGGGSNGTHPLARSTYATGIPYVELVGG